MTHTMDRVKSEESIFKRPRFLKKLNKKEISAPCNFKHVSGVYVCVSLCSICVGLWCECVCVCWCVLYIFLKGNELVQLVLMLEKNI